MHPDHTEPNGVTHQDPDRTWAKPELDVVPMKQATGGLDNSYNPSDSSFGYGVS